MGWFGLIKVCVQECVKRVLRVPVLLLFANFIPFMVHAEEALRLSIEAGFDIALQRKEELSIARSDIGISQAQLREVRAEGLPQMGTSLNYTRNWLLPSFVFDSNTVRIGDDNDLIGVLTMRQSVYKGGRIRSSVQAARHHVSYSKENARLVKQKLIALIETSFYDYLLAVELLRASQASVDRSVSNLNQVGALYRAGRVAEYDLIRARVQLSEVRVDSIRAANGVKLAEVKVKDSIGLELNRQIEIVAEFRKGTLLESKTLDELTRLGFETRPDWRKVELHLSKLRRNIDAERARTRPEIDLLFQGQMQLQSDKMELGKREDWRRSWSTGVLMKVPLYGGGRSRARVTRAKHEFDRLEAERQRLKRSLELDIRTTYVRYGEAGERLRATYGTVEQARQGLRVIESRYAAGVGTQLEVLDAQLILVEAEGSLATARRDRALAGVELERATGVLGEEISMVEPQ